MTLSRWGLLVLTMTLLGVSLVAERTAVFQQSYAVGSRVRKLHVEEMQLAWQRGRVMGQASPSALSAAEEKRGFEFVSRAVVQTERKPAGFIQVAAEESRR